MNSVARIRASADVLFSDLGDGVALFDVRSGIYFNLNGSAGIVWLYIEEPRTKAEIVDHLLSAFEIDRSTAENDVHALVEAFRENELVSVEDLPVSSLASA